jgi:hypothetical protein
MCGTQQEEVCHLCDDVTYQNASRFLHWEVIPASHIKCSKMEIITFLFSS